MSGRLPFFSKREKGQALAETAVISVVAILLIFGTFSLIVIHRAACRGDFSLVCVCTIFEPVARSGGCATASHYCRKPDGEF